MPKAVAAICWRFYLVFAARHKLPVSPVATDCSQTLRLRTELRGAIQSLEPRDAEWKSASLFAFEIGSK